MRVLVTGAYGLIGSAVLARLHRDGHNLTALGRKTARARRQYDFAHWIEVDFRTLTTVETWEPLLEGIDAVVNCVGALQDSLRDDVERVQFEATRVLFDTVAAKQGGKLIHISAIGADEEGSTKFSRSKGRADNYLKSLDLDWTVLHPGLVLARQAYGGTAMLRALAAFPLVTPLAHGDARIQIVDIDDLTETVAFCLSGKTARKIEWDVAQPQVYSLREIVAALRQWLGLRPRSTVEIPRGLLALIAAAADLLGWLGWRSPARSTAMNELHDGVVGDPAGWMEATKIQPKRLKEILEASPAGVQEIWFAKLYLLKPFLFAGIGLFWTASGAIALGPGREAALATLAAAGFSGGAASILLLGAILDIVLGLLVLVRKLARVVLYAMLIVSATYLASATVFVPHLWADPLGPLLKIIPVLIATFGALAILDER